MIIPSSKYLKEVKFDPKPDKWQVNAAAFDLRIGSKLLHTENNIERSINGLQKLIIAPGSHFLIQTLEKITLPNDIIGVVYPRSGTNRKGITVDMTGIVDPGYSGHLMIPVSNLTKSEISFYAGERIAQIVFQRVEEKVEIRESKYHENSMEEKPDKKEELELLKSGKLFKDKINNYD